MSTIVRGPDGRIKLFTKGADTVIYERLAQTSELSDATLVHLEVSLAAAHTVAWLHLTGVLERITPRKV